MAVTRIEEGGLGTDSFNLPITLNGTDGSSTDAGDNLVLDASASGVDAGERLLYNGIPPDLAGNFSSNVNVLSGVTLTIDDGATIVNSGTATGFGSNEPTSADGQALGSTTAEWSDLYLADGGIVYFGNDQEITLTHSADSGLLLKHTATADDKPINLVLQTGETDMAANDVIGKISFQAPDEGTGTDAILVSAAIQAVAEGDHSSSSNATTLQFMTGASEAAAAKVYIKSDGDVGIGTATPADILHSYSTSNDKTWINESTGGNAMLQLRGNRTGDQDIGHMKFYNNAASADLVSIRCERAGADNSGLFKIQINNAGTLDSDAFVLDKLGNTFLGDTANGYSTVGLTINQGAYDDHILSLKSSDISHSATSTADADTYAWWKKYSATDGGVYHWNGTEGSAGFWHDVSHDTQQADAASNTAVCPFNWRAVVTADSYAHDGNTALFAWRKTISGGASRNVVLFDEDGDIHLDGSTTAFDKEDDALLCRSFDLALADPKSIIKSEFDDWTANHKEKLIDAGILGRVDPDNPANYHYPEQAVPGSPASDPSNPPVLGESMINSTQLQRLHNGAIVQQRLMFETLKEVAEELIPGFANKLNERLVSKNLPALPVY